MTANLMKILSYSFITDNSARFVGFNCRLEKDNKMYTFCFYDGSFHKKDQSSVISFSVQVAIFKKIFAQLKNRHVF